MIELPEAATIAEQMTLELEGKIIVEAEQGHTPHKLAFVTRSPDEYRRLLEGATLGPSASHGSLILTQLLPDHVLVLGGGGERILLHRDESTLPKKHQLLVRFADDTALSVTVQGWGSVQFYGSEELADHPYIGKKGPSPISEGFSEAYWQSLFVTLDPGSRSSVKYFCISEPGVLEVGNGCLQDILYEARLHPRRRAVALEPAERQRLYQAIKRVLGEAVEKGGRDSERDLYGRPGGYQRILHSKAAGQPCTRCGELITKMQYLGGACYYCPSCQPADET